MSQSIVDPDSVTTNLSSERGGGGPENIFVESYVRVPSYALFLIHCLCSLYYRPKCRPQTIFNFLVLEYRKL